MALPAAGDGLGWQVCVDAAGGEGPRAADRLGRPGGSLRPRDPPDPDTEPSRGDPAVEDGPGTAPRDPRAIPDRSALLQDHQACLDRDGRSEDVADRRSVLDVLTQLLELLGGRVRPHPTPGADLREPGTRSAEPQEPMEVDVALDLVAELLDLDATGGRVVHEADGVAEAQRLKHQLDGVRTFVRAQEQGRLVADQLERRRSFRGR